MTLSFFVDEIVAEDGEDDGEQAEDEAIVAPTGSDVLEAREQDGEEAIAIPANDRRYRRCGGRIDWMATCAGKGLCRVRGESASEQVSEVSSAENKRRVCVCVCVRDGTHGKHEDGRDHRRPDRKVRVRRIRERREEGEHEGRRRPP